MTNCKNCKKSSHLLFKCLCLEEYCTKCRLPEKHNCVELKAKMIKDKTLLQNKIIVKKVDII